MADTTSSHDLPYPEGADDAVPHSDIKNLAEKLDTELDHITPSQIVGPTAGQLLIANSSGVITGTAVTGDIAIDSSGQAEIQPGKVGTTEVAGKAITTAKIDDNAVTRAKLGPTLQTVGFLIAAAGGSQTITWSTPFPNLNYLVTVGVEAPGSEGNTGGSVVLRNKTTGGITVGWNGYAGTGLSTVGRISLIAVAA